MRALAAGALRAGVDFWVVGDSRGPSSFAVEGATFLSLETQSASRFEYAVACPTGTYARKNVGYLHAVAGGAGVIVETDDDNHPRPTFFAQRHRDAEGVVFREAGWVNVYQAFTEEIVWPRGFPLRHILAPLPAGEGADVMACPIQQGLADDDPDVDAIYRLVGGPRVEFADRSALILTDGSWCPFNSQNTTHFPEVFPLMYLPHHCAPRMSDIWRGFVAQRVLWANGWGLLFHGATVWQERNEHDLMKDFREEVDGYLHNEEIVDRLAALDIPAGDGRVAEAHRVCYEELVRMGRVDRAELDLIEAFQSDLEAAR